MTLVFLAKIFMACIWLIIVRGTLPRYRLDVLASKTWKEWALMWTAVLMLNTLAFLVL